MKHDYGMSARQRFVVGARLLLVAMCLLIAGRVVWSRVETRHVYTITGPIACPQAVAEVASDDAGSDGAIISTLVPVGHGADAATMIGGDSCGTHTVSTVTTT